MQSNRLILWSSLAALVLCAVPYGCAGKSIGSSNAQEGSTNPYSVDGASSGDAVYQGDGGIRFDDGARSSTDGSSFIPRDGSPFNQGDGVPIRGDGDCCADGWLNNADGDNRGDGDPTPDGRYDSSGYNANADGWADGNL